MVLVLPGGVIRVQQEALAEEVRVPEGWEAHAPELARVESVSALPVVLRLPTG